MNYYFLGLGNPEPKYEFTRHNIGHLFLDHMMSPLNLKWEASKNRDFLYKVIDQDRLTLIKPQNYINNNGEVIYKMWKANLINWVVISDDLDQPLGNYKIKMNGGAGGHNGLKSVEAALGTQEYVRVKIGIGPRPVGAVGDYVMGEFSAADLKTLAGVFDLALQELKFHKILE